jgi:hypothetical protein
MTALRRWLTPQGKGWWRLLVTIPLCYAAYAGVAYFAQDRLIFPRHALPTEPWPADSNRSKTLTITTAAPDAGLTIPALLLLPAPSAGITQGALAPVPSTSATRGPGTPGSTNSSTKRPAAIVFHGNADLAPSYAQSAEVQALLRMGFVVLLPEYRGYNVPGQPSQAALVGDARQFAALLAQQPGVDPERILYLGRSLGTGVACALAAEAPAGAAPRALVLISPLTSVASFARRLGLPPAIVKHPFRNDDALAAINQPVLIAHGTADRIIPIDHAHTLARLAPTITLVEDASDHNDFPADAPAFEDALLSFLTRAGLLVPQGNSP